MHLDSARQEVSFETQGRPRTLTIDPSLRVFRRLDPRELPPILRQVTLDPCDRHGAWRPKTREVESDRARASRSD